MKCVPYLAALLLTLSLGSVAHATNTTVGGEICHPKTPADAANLQYGNTGVTTLSTTAGPMVSCAIPVSLATPVTRVRIVGYNRNLNLSLFCNIDITTITGAVAAVGQITFQPGVGLGVRDDSFAFNQVGTVHLNCRIPPFASAGNSALTSISVDTQ